MQRGFLAGLLGLLLGMDVCAQDRLPERSGWELGARYWLSTGQTKRSHNAQGEFPVLGNPTSVLTYDDLTAHAIELHARKSFANRWFVKGNLGLGEIKRGGLEDEDFFAGQVKFSESTSSVRGNRLYYGIIDVGRDVWTARDGSTLGPFIGYQQWSERVDAYGASWPVNFLMNPDLANGVPIISNEVRWRFLRVGLAAKTFLAPKTRLIGELVLIPVAQVRDEDSHWLRTDPSDLGPTPNVHVNGRRGTGYQFDIELRHAFRERWEFGAGLRYWYVNATRGERSAVGSSSPLNELKSTRAGLMLSITRLW